MGVEHEAKLLAEPGFELPELAGLGKGVRTGPSRRFGLESVYYDSADLVLARAGVTLRHRTGEDGPQWTIKFPRHGTDSTLTRHEIEFDGPADTVPSAALDLVRAYLRGRELRVAVRFRTTRTAVPLVDERGVRVAEVAHDVVTPLDVNGQRGFHEVEVELAEGAGAAGAGVLSAAVDRLVAAGAHTAPPVPKMVRLLGGAAAEPPEIVPVRLGAEPNLADLVRSLVAGPVVDLVGHDAGVRIGADPEDVHRFRVAARRLRSNLKTFGPVLRPDWAEPLRVELAWLGSEVGAVRDADVLHERLRGQAAELPEADAVPVRLLLAYLVAEREKSREAMLRALRGDRYVALLDALVDAAGQPRFAADVAENGPAERFVLPAVRHQWRRLARAVAALDKALDKESAADAGGDPSDASLHRVRILAKRCRYAAEMAVPVVGRPAGRLARAMADVQTVLGDHQDAIVAEAWLRGVAARHPRTGLVAGELIARQRLARAEKRREWPSVWRAASAEKLRSWL